MTPEPGDIILVPFPFTDLKGKKSRPALVLSSKQYNAASQDVIICAITSNLTDAAYSVLVTQHDLTEGRLKTTSRIKVGKLATLQQSIIRKRIGAVRPGILEQATKELAAMFPRFR